MIDHLPDNYTIRLLNLPITEGGMISEDPDGHINIYLNARLSSSGRLKAADHEFNHWYNDDLNNHDSIQKVERRADRQTKDKRLLCTLKRARDLQRPANRLSQPKRVQFHTYEDWKDDIIHTLPIRD